VFGCLHILFRDWNAVPSAEETSAQCAQRILFEEERGFEASVRDRNRVRREIQRSFESVSVHCFPRPCGDTARRIPVDEVSGAFMEVVQGLKRQVCEQLATPRQFCGKPITPGSLAQLLPELARSGTSQALKPQRLLQQMQAEEAKALARAAQAELNSCYVVIKERARASLDAGDTQVTTETVLAEWQANIDGVVAHFAQACQASDCGQATSVQECAQKLRDVTQGQTHELNNFMRDRSEMSMLRHE
jgi:hypothetical protein